jgi:succinate dehydrogenase flavin-adding protein (antitoxin of CptAB toxin-antitoxin module)
MKEYQMKSFNRFFASEDPELFALFGSHLSFIPDSTGDLRVANMMGKQHFTEEQGEKFKQIVLKFEEENG